LTIINLSASQNLDKWYKLLHYQNNENLIISNEFYLSNSNYPSPKEELDSTIGMLNSKLGFETACNFPARYKYLKNNNYEVPNFNLKKCVDLNNYIKSFSKDKINLVFSSEYTNNPSSAFGHIMLLFSDKNKSIEESDVIHFAAQTPRTDGFFKYSYKGLSGKYNGYFIREPFFKKLHEYNTLEQRYLYVYELDFKKEQIEFLLYHLYELRKATFKYYFFDVNCASQISDLLALIDDRNAKSNYNFYLPIYSLMDFENRITNQKSFMPTINKINYLINKMNPEEKKLFFNNIKYSNKVDESYTNILKESIQLNTILKFRKFNIVDKNYENVMNQTFIKNEIIDTQKHPLKKVKPTNLELGYLKTYDNFIFLKYRPLFTELNDFQFNNLQKSEINTLTWEVLLNNSNSKLNYLNLINIKSLPKQLTFYNPLSWSLYLGLNRLNSYNDLKINTEAGFGRTFNIIENLHSSLLINLGFDNENIYLKPFVYLDYEFETFKLSTKYEYKTYLNKDYFYIYSLSLSKKFNDKFLNFEISNLSSYDELDYKLSFKINF